MLFNSFQFLLFFPVVTAGYFVLPFRVRWVWLLLASCYFYMCFIPIYILILLFTISVDYAAGRLIEGAAGRRRKAILICSIVANVGVLAFFKYANFFNANVAALAQMIGWNYSIAALKIILPIGLSFHTFQSLSYTIEVYRGNQRSERHFGIFALYVMFYPQLVAGPIERPQNLLHQFREKHAFDGSRVRDGVLLIAWGLVKKAVIADRISVLVDQVYRHPANFYGLPLIIATVFFAFQIYCDFSGYSDIARGCAQVMGFRLMENFRQPYFASSIVNFWKRWHISLSTWFRDYLYIPLGGSHVIAPRWMFNVFLTFLVSGLWHGANWTFVAWGALHATFFAFSHFSSKLRKVKVSPNNITGTIGTFAAVTFAWIFFRAENISDAFYVATHMHRHFSTSLIQMSSQLKFLKIDWIISMFFLAILFAVEAVSQKTDPFAWITRQTAATRWGAYAAFLFAIVVFGVFRQAQFIYFQF